MVESSSRQHQVHQMQITSYLCYFPSWNEEEFNQAFRQEIKRNIIRILQGKESMTDRELARFLGYSDPNKIRPRRNELVKEGLIEEDVKRLCAVGLKLSIAWRLNRSRLLAFMEVAR